MDEWTDRLLPYFSIGINVMLCLSIILESGAAERAVVYGTKYASVILTLIDLALL